jgi:CHAD domain-containing protein
MKTRENVLIAALDERWKKFRAELKTCQRDFSEEAVHDLRVTTRRLLAVMDILRTLDPHPRIQKTRRVLKNQLDSLNDLRDVQVMLVEISESVANFPEMKPFELSLLAREKKLLGRARKEIKALQTSEVKRRIEKTRVSLAEKVRSPGINTQLLSAVDQVYSQAMQAFGQIDASQSATIHRFRVTFKKFRYMVEVVSPTLKNYPETGLKQMHDYQSKMGDVQDVEVFLSALGEYSQQKDSLAALEKARRAFEDQRIELISTFMNGREEIRVFWRGLPDQNFPWEQKNEPVHNSSRNRSGGGGTRVRKRQPASTDRQGQKENAKDREGVEGAGSGDQSDPHQPISSRGGNGKDSQEDV